MNVDIPVQNRSIAEYPAPPETLEECVPGRYYQWAGACGGINYALECVDCHQHVPHGAAYTEFDKKTCVCRTCAPKHNASVAVGPRAAIELNFPPEFIDANMSQVEPKLRSLKEWSKKRPFIAIFGSPGTGKTFALWALQRHLAGLGFRVTYENALSFRERWFHINTRARTETALMNAPRLIVDEFSTPDAAFGWAEFVHRLISHRVTHALPTILAMHEGLKRISEKYGVAVASRMHMFSPIYLTGPDKRIPKPPAEKHETSLSLKALVKEA